MCKYLKTKRLEQLMDMNPSNLTKSCKGKWHHIYFIKKKNRKSNCEPETECRPWLLDPWLGQQHTHPKFPIRTQSIEEIVIPIPYC